MLFTVSDVLNRHRVHVVDVDLVVDLVTGDTKVATQVSSDYEVPSLPPLPRGVKILVDPAIPSKGRITNLALEAQVAETLFETLKTAKLGI